MSMPRCDQAEAWKALQAHYDAHGREFDLRAAFDADAGRFGRFCVQAPGVFADLSKNRWDDGTRALLTGLATEKLAEGIRAFAADSVKLDALIEAAR